MINKKAENVTKRKSLNIDYDLARKLELKAVELETTQTILINKFIKDGLEKLENQTTLNVDVKE